MAGVNWSTAAVAAFRVLAKAIGSQPDGDFLDRTAKTTIATGQPRAGSSPRACSAAAAADWVCCPAAISMAEQVMKTAAAA